jgi:hypothetical protein
MTPQANTTDGGINTPEVGKDLKPTRRSITDVQQLKSIATTLEEASRDRNQKNGRIMAKYNAERPYEMDKLKAENLSWKSNFSTKPLAVAVDKIGPRLTRAVNTARYLTSASLPETVSNGKSKTERFRKEITNAIRRWPGWRPLISEIAQETGLFGYTSVFFVDRYSWKPYHFRQDRFFIPDQTKQFAENVQVWMGHQDLQIHELLDTVGEDPEIAKSAGWEIDAVVQSVNEAAPKSSLNQSSPFTDVRLYQDAIRESSIHLSLQQGAKSIEVNHFLVREPSGKVSYYLTDRRNKQQLLRQQLDLYESMSEAIVLFSYQQANGLLMGSKGVGRELYEVAGAVDRSRNELVDRLNLSGKVWLKGSAKSLDRIQLSVVGNMVLFPDTVEVQSVKIDPNVEAFREMDMQLVQLMDQIAGGVTPKEFRGERVTATAVNVYTAREEEKRDDIIERFLLQVGDLVSVLQRRLVNAEMIDPEVAKLRENLLRYMSEEELLELASQPALKTVADWTEVEAQQLVMLAAEKRQDPLYDHVKLERMATAARTSQEVADDVLLPVNDPTQEAEQAQKQTLENIVLSLGKKMPVSPRDGHRVHTQILQADLQGILQAPPDPAIIQAYLSHWQEHISAAIQAGDKESDWSDDVAQIEALTQAAQQPPPEAAMEQAAPAPEAPPEQGESLIMPEHMAEIQQAAPAVAQ